MGDLYMKRLKDLEFPHKEDSPLFLDPRPNNNQQENIVVETEKKASNPIPTPLTEIEKAKLRDDYKKNIASPATTTWKTFPEDGITEIIPGKAWVVPRVLTEEECEEIVQAGEDFGMEGTKTHHLITKENIIRTSKRTNGWSNEALSIRLKGKLSEELLTKIEASAPYTSVRGIHPNWRVAMYRDGETFPAHIDQADSVMVEHPEKMRQRFTSSHTLLIYLRRPGEQFQGGATRLFVDGNYTGNTVDVLLPQGFGLVFQQKEMLHAGLPVTGEDPKYIAQAGVLRGEPDGITGRCAVFRYGPGLKSY